MVDGMQNATKSEYIDRAPAEQEGLPTGPFRQADTGPCCSLLIFVPRNAISALINDMTGGCGYSHLAIDCGDIDIPTGKPVMVESTVGVGVHNSFQDEYGTRKFVRITLEEAGVDAQEFRDCVRSRLGEAFDNGEALTLGLLDNPAKQVCSDLATICLPEATRTDIAHHHQAGLFHPLAAVRLHGDPGKAFRLFVSPNGFAEYLGAPRGEDLTGPDQLAEPTLPAERVRRASR
jgi:hypothetical protein